VVLLFPGILMVSFGVMLLSGRGTPFVGGMRRLMRMVILLASSVIIPEGHFDKSMFKIAVLFLHHQIR
jgi:hypothetical protein